MTSGTVPLQDVGDTVEARVLLAALHQDPTQIEGSGIEHLTPAQWDRLVTLAGQQRVRPLLHRRLAERGCGTNAPVATWQRLVDECRAIAVRKLRMHAELATLLSALAARGIPAVPLKGAYLGPAVYGNIALREMGDIDLLVPRDQLAAAVECVLALGYGTPNKFSVEADAGTMIHVTRLTRPGGFGVEIHWNITSPNERTSIAPETVWQRARVNLPPHVSPTSLSPADTLLHLCCHASYQHHFEFGLRPSCDIAYVIAHWGAELNWSDVVKSSQRRHWARGVGLALQLSRTMVGASVPDPVLQELLPGSNAAALTAATQLVWTSPTSTAQFSPNLAILAHGPFHARLNAVRLRVFVPRHELTAFFGGRLSGHWRLHWARRLWNLLRRHSGPAARLLLRRNRAEDALALHRNRIRAWLDDRAA